MTPFLAAPLSTTARLRLVCLPFAGGGTGIFRTWPAAMGPDVDVLPIQLPGRERRLRDRPYTSMDALLADLVPAMAEVLQGQDWAVFGHSLGGAMAYELSVALARRGQAPRGLWVSARRAPGVPLPHPPLFALPDDRMVAEVERFYGALPDLFKQHPGLLSTFLPTLRADLTVLDTWRPTPGLHLRCPVTVLGGADDHAVPADTMATWAAVTTGAFSQHQLPGGHFYVRDRDDARDLVAAQVRALLAG